MAAPRRVRTFHDSNGDGIGDFQGLEGKLDYLQKLGINAIWLMPFFPSPLRDDGYDISDYNAVHSSYGTLEDFQKHPARLDANSALDVTLDGSTAGTNYTQLQAGGAISLANATLNVTLGSGFTPTGGETFTIVNNTGTSTINGTFDRPDRGVDAHRLGPAVHYQLRRRHE